ncbi:uncharacterized protein [Diadema antillarum]|uniref:uncharacterized protein n=1 Tax=Diadema antillarum TaxID=105358 RepID=UPI003A8686FE
MSKSGPICALVYFWVMVSFMGSIKLIGVLYPELRLSFKASAGDIGLAIGVMNVVMFVQAPVVAYVYKRVKVFYKRGLLVGGTVLPALGLASASCVQNSSLFTVCLAVAGLGYGICNITMLIEMNEQDNTRFPMFFSFGRSGIPVGMVLIPMAGEFLMKVYGWQGAMLIISGAIANTIPMSLAIQPLHSTAHQSAAEKIEDIHDDRDMRHKLTTLGREKHLRAVNSTEEDEASRQEVIMAVDESSDSCSESEWVTHQRRIRSNKYNTNHEEESQPCLSRREEDKTSFSQKCLSLIRWMKKSEFIIRNPNVMFIYLACVPCYMVYGGWHAFLIPRALELRNSVRHVVILTSCVALSNFCARIIFGLCSQKLTRYIDVYLVLSLVNVLSLLTDVLTFGGHTFYVLVTTATVSSACIACRSIVATMIIRQNVCEENFPIALALEELVGGTSIMFGAYFSGLFADLFGSFNYSFMLLIVLDALNVLLMLPVKCNPSSGTEKDEEIVPPKSACTNGR